MAKETDKRVFVALINNNYQVLVIKRAKTTNNGGQLGLPGGHLNEGETLEAAARREVSEEIGLEIDFTQRSFIKAHADDKRTILVARMPLGHTWIQNLDPKEVEAVYWMKVNQIATIHHAVSDATEEGEVVQLHRSLELALPILMDLEPAAIVSALTRRH